MRIRSLVAGVLALAGSCMFAVGAEKTYKISVTGGFVDDGLTSRSGLYAGDEVFASIDESKLYDKNGNEVNAFAKWTYTPATADLGAGFDPFFNPEVMVTMPNADVKLTANFVNGFAAYVCAEVETQGEAEPGDFYWSIDNGKTLIPFGDYRYPVKAGKVTVKFYDKTGNWRASDNTLMIDKRGSRKEGNVTIYDEPAEKYTFVTFVPVNNSTKVKFDPNGGGTAWDAFVANGYEFGELTIPSRKGYIFAGWRTAKDGGELVTESTICAPVLFAGQKTPTLYANWLQLKKLTLKDDSAAAEWYLSEEDFDPELYPIIMHSIFLTNPALENGGYLEGKGVMEVLPGARVTIAAESYLYDEKKDIELVFQKWTVTPANADFGPEFQVSRYSTELTMPSADVTLQATYVDESTCGWVYPEVQANSVNLGWDDETGEEITIDPPSEAFEWSPDGGKTWYKSGYWDEDGDWYEDDDTGEWYWVDYGRYWASQSVLLKKGTYTITWRSTDSRWTTADSGKKITINPYDEVSVSATFSFIPQVVVDVMTFEDGECALSPTGGTVTMNPKDGLVPIDKTITFTAKANKNYFSRATR